jgi:hypothetical protein
VAIQLEWKNGRRIAYLVYSGVLDMDIVHAVEAEMTRVMDASSLPVHAILDLRQLDQFPPLIECIRSPYVRHKQRGWTIIIGLTEKPLFRVLVNSLINGLRLPAHQVESLEEALTVLKKEDSSL